MFVFFFVFFFQAEDGIRDLIVTGVQTCALPILATHYGNWEYLSTMSLITDVSYYGSYTRIRNPYFRSEERRVGKECRSRWSRDH